MGMAIGGSFAGDLSVVATSGPGMCLKSELIGLASITELPVVIVDVQRGGPSTGLPTKTEQSDLRKVCTLDMEIVRFPCWQPILLLIALIVQ